MRLLASPPSILSRSPVMNAFTSRREGLFVLIALGLELGRRGTATFKPLGTPAPHMFDLEEYDAWVSQSRLGALIFF